MLLQPRQDRDLFGLADGEGAAGTLRLVHNKKELADARFMDNLVGFDKDAIAPEVLQKLLDLLWS